MLPADFTVLFRDFFIEMSGFELLTIIAGAGAVFAFTLRIVINKSRKSSSKQIAKARDDAEIDQKHFHAERDIHFHEAPKTPPDSIQTVNSAPEIVQPPDKREEIIQAARDLGKQIQDLKPEDLPEGLSNADRARLSHFVKPTRSVPLSSAERDLLSVIEPGGYFVIIKTLSKHCVVYGMPLGPLKEFLDRDDPMVATAYIEALQSLVHRRFIKKTKDEYTLTVKGDIRRTLMLDSG